LPDKGEWLTQPGGLAERLRRLRRSAGLTGDQLASRLGWARTKVPKIENGHQMPTDEDVTRWVEACGQPADVATEYLDLLTRAQTQYRRWKHELRQGHAAIQISWDRLVRQARTVRNFEIVVIPGLLQTPEYARYRAVEAVRNYGAAEERIDEAVTMRMRRQEVLYEPGRTFEFVTTEAALRIGACPAEAMIGQLDRLNVLSQLPNITLGIIPLGVPLPAMPQNPFIILDDKVIAETHGSEATIGGNEVEMYQRLADALLAEAMTGNDARSLITSAVAWWGGQAERRLGGAGNQGG
jgi:transcriptional regulator with XRE-family HTH domain